MKTVTCTALCEFTRYVEGYGQVVGAPDSSLDEAKKPEVPTHVVDAFAAEGLISAPGTKGKAKEATPASASEDAPPA